MGSFGSFFKGEKKKKKRGEQSSQISYAPAFTPPEVINKGKKPKI